MASRTPFPDVEVALLDGLADLAGTGTVTPPTLDTALPFVRVQRAGGSDDHFYDQATVHVDAFATTRTDARVLAETIRQRLLTWPVVLGGVVFDRATTLTAPAEVPWSTVQKLHRYTASYRLTVRR